MFGQLKTPLGHFTSGFTLGSTARPYTSTFVLGRAKKQTVMLGSLERQLVELRCRPSPTDVEVQWPGGPGYDAPLMEEEGAITDFFQGTGVPRVGFNRLGSF